MAKKKNSKDILKYIKIFEKNSGKIMIEVPEDIDIEDMIEFTLSLFVVTLEQLKNEKDLFQTPIDNPNISANEFVKLFLSLIAQNYFDHEKGDYDKPDFIYDNSDLSEKEVEMAKTFSKVFKESNKLYYEF